MWMNKISILHEIMANSFRGISCMAMDFLAEGRGKSECENLTIIMKMTGHSSCRSNINVCSKIDLIQFS